MNKEWNRLNWDIDDIAKRRDELHKNHASSTPFSKDYERIGVLGEVRFSDHSLLNVDIKDRPGGDGGIDFILSSGYTVNVSTARKPDNLLLPIRGIEQCADILVLGKYIEDTDKAILLGWEWSKEMKKCPSRDFGYGLINHFKYNTRLKPIESLAKYQQPWYMWNVRKQKWELENNITKNTWGVFFDANS